MSSAPLNATLDSLRERVRLLERPAARHLKMAPFGVPAIDSHLPEQGLPLAALHEISGGAENAACATLFTAGILARLSHPVLWCTAKPASVGVHIFAPGLAGAGLAPDRLLHAEAPDEKTVFAVMEEALRHPGLSAVVGEVLRLPMTASRRLVLAAEKSGVMAIALRRRMEPDPAPNAACTRWRITPLPAPALPIPGLVRARWQVELTRCRGATPQTWIMEACDAQGSLAVPAVLDDRQVRAA
jgi:protein ImuA